jgi:streptogramin lyase
MPEVIGIGRSPFRALLAVIAALAVGAAFWSPAAGAEPVGVVEHLPTRCDVEKLVSGPGEDVWFSCFRPPIHFKGIGKSIIGKMTQEGTVTEFNAGIPSGLAISALAAGPDGNLWFTLEGGFGPPAAAHGDSAIGRITPEGVVTIFTAGLRKRSTPREILVGPDGNLWFTDSTPDTAISPMIGRVTPQGSITEFPTGLAAALGIGGLAVGPDGNLWFTQSFDLPHGDEEPGGLIGRLSPSGSVTSFGGEPGAFAAPVAGADGNVWFAAGAGPVTIDRVTPSGEITAFGRSKVGAPHQLVVGPDGNIWFTAQQSIGRVTPSGQVSKFTGCMDFREDFSEATSIISGPGGDLWFSTVTSRMTPSIAEHPTIGRVTTNGEITLFKDGVANQRSIIAGPDGKVWFAGDGQEIERITPPTAPVNTFVFSPGRASFKRGKANLGGIAGLSVEVPGPGTLDLVQLAAMLPETKTKRLPAAPAVRVVAKGCGPTRLKLPLAGAATAKLRRYRRVLLKVRATFTPNGGSANTQVETIELHGGPQ